MDGVTKPLSLGRQRLERLTSNQMVGPVIRWSVNSLEALPGGYLSFTWSYDRYIEDLTRVVISYEIYKTSFQAS